MIWVMSFSVAFFKKIAKNKSNPPTSCNIYPNLIGGKMVEMIWGLCMKCKEYVKIGDHEKITMSNGRTRVAGSCSKNSCSGRISKIIS